MIFADVVGSTALGEQVDPETLRWAMQRWFGRMGDAIERHGGTVENFIGDAVMGVFGIPVVHEDDALRAVRAAAEMREEVAALRGELGRERGVELAVRIGVNTGEAVTGVNATGGFFTAGDIVNVAARLEQAAPPGDILLGHDTFTLVRHAVDAEPVAPLTVKGKRAALEAFRLLAVASDARGRPQRPRAPMVGRQRERRRLLDAFHQAVADRSCQLFTVLGTAGVGKSRLVTEALETINGAATVAVGRCLPYGDGLTWWPLVEALGRPGLLERAAPDAGDAIARVSDLLEPAGPPVAPEEAFWAVRKVLEALGRRQPVVLVVDDLQWAEPTFVDLIEHISDWARDAPLLLLIMARPELLDIRPGWGGGKLNATSVLLEPLAEDDAAHLLQYLLGTARLGDRTTERILDVAEGNPLYVEEIVALLADERLLDAPDRDLPIAVPPTIHALLAARLDGLEREERAVIEAAAIEGREFTRERVEELVGDRMRARVGRHLLALVRTDLIRPVDAQEGVFRFRHQLIRDAAYDGISKDARAVLHERFADWLEEHRSSLPSVDELLGHHLERAVLLHDEIVAHHLERAYHYRAELGRRDDETERLRRRAAGRMSAAARRVFGRGDMSGAAKLLTAAVELLDPADAERSDLLLLLGNALTEIGQFREARRILDQTRLAAQAMADRRLELHVDVESRLLDLRTDASGVAHDHVKATEHAISVFDDAGDELGLSRAFLLLGYVDLAVTCSWGSATEHLQRALEHARRAHDRRHESDIVFWLAVGLQWGPTPAREALRRGEAMLAQTGGNLTMEAAIRYLLGLSWAMLGSFERARSECARGREILSDLGLKTKLAGSSQVAGYVELLAGDPAAAERELRESYEVLRAAGETSIASTSAALLAQAVAEQGRHDESLELSRLSATMAARDDLASQAFWRTARANVLIARANLAEAHRLAAEAVAITADTDFLLCRATAALTLGQVLAAAHRFDEATRALTAALEAFEAKGDVVSTRRARMALDRLPQPA